MMQVIVILLVMPWLLLLSKYKMYKSIRILGAGIAIFASSVWLMERITFDANFASPLLNGLTSHAVILIPILMILSIYCHFISKRNVIKK